MEEFQGVSIHYLDWQSNLLPGVSVELIEVASGEIDLSEIYVKPGTSLELEELEFLEAKIALL